MKKKVNSKPHEEFKVNNFVQFGNFSNKLWMGDGKNNIINTCMTANAERRMKEQKKHTREKNIILIFSQSKRTKFSKKPDEKSSRKHKKTNHETQGLLVCNLYKKGFVNKIRVVMFYI